jgi:DnaJ-class molecular chaperone with C-terminal Zn finger domain
MTKHKLDITKNHLSGEKTHFKKCDKNGCKQKGEYRAPKSRLMLNQYYFFCSEHIKEYNKSWDFYKGLSVSQIETSVREDTIRTRPSWPLKGNPYKVIEQINEFFTDEFIPDEEKNKYFQNKILDENLTSEENKALSTLKLNLPITLEKIKKNYKKLVKIFHPDVNGNNKKAEEKFKEINQSYKTLLQKGKNEQKV